MHRSRKLRPALSTSGFVFLRTESQTVSIPLIILILSFWILNVSLLITSKVIIVTVISLIFLHIPLVFGKNAHYRKDETFLCLSIKAKHQTIFYLTSCVKEEFNGQTKKFACDSLESLFYM